MLKPELAEQIIREVCKVLNGEEIPLTVKIRAGWDSENINAVPFAQMIESAGASAIIVHPRTRSQLFTGLSDWNIIKQVKEKVNIPVIGNGDINSSEDVMRMYKETGCDSVMIGRGALGKPWIFSNYKSHPSISVAEISDFPISVESIVPIGKNTADKCAVYINHPPQNISVLQTAESNSASYSASYISLEPPCKGGHKCVPYESGTDKCVPYEINSVVKLSLMYEHIDRVLEHYQDPRALIPMRAHFAYYTKGYTDGAKARKQIFSTTCPEEIKNILKELIIPIDKN